MTRQSAFSAPGRFWRGNLHSHSNRSDGALTPEEVCRRYRAEGYDFLALTDHYVGIYDYPLVDTTPFRQADFTTILGAELHSGAMENGELWHILAVGLPADFPKIGARDWRAAPDQESGPALAARAAAAGAFVTIAHPQWSGMTLADARSITAAHAVEIYNHGSAVCNDRGDGTQIADLLISEGRDLSLIATDDSHFKDPDYFGGWTMVKAEENTPEALLAALKRGDFYSSEGPEIHDFRVAGDTVHVECSAVERVIALGQGSSSNCLWGKSLTRAELSLQWQSDTPWLRVVVIDAAGRRAWSNPIRRA
ncbi:CehA/McbA family metallohydrolase [Xinfangfangia sp. D13-10-4-6]|uniref:PHP domain-containing protein n=1 Tax=Pseudogemmobacter hezensis TaxID=2737662 RepID=UPI0015547718|nr:CehA/McbA family metallohydrolase [Pseudogemmobacter hezensis]NPD15882.1 CehA/McbA family metallohydrolase [Pseudogemmobacter hezensis]